MKIRELLFIKLIFNAFILILILDCINDFSYINMYAMHSNLKYNSQVSQKMCKIDQQIARHFVHYSKYLYNPLPFYATQIITLFKDLSKSR